MPTLPNDQALEGLVLGLAMTDPTTASEMALALEGVDFVQALHQTVFGAIRELHERGLVVDSAAVVSELKSTGAIQQLGDSIPYIRALAMSAPESVSNSSEYIAKLKSLSLRRALIARASEALKASGDLSIEVDELVDRVAEDFLDLSLRRGSDSGEKTLAQVVATEFDRLRKASEAEEELLGVRTGFYGLDEKLCGLQPGDFVVLAGRPSMGKTAFALEATRHAASHDETPTLLISLEMRDRNLVQRLLASVGRVDGQLLRRPKRISGEEWSRITAAAGKLDTKKLLVSDRPNVTVADVRTQARRCVSQYGVGLLVVDYLQLMRPTHRQQNREREVAEMSLGLKALAGELNIPVVCLCQLNRAVENREDKRPRLSDLRESGALEQDADVVLFVHRPAYYDNNADASVAEIIVAKQRNGPTGIVKLHWDAKSARFDNLQHGAE